MNSSFKIMMLVLYTSDAGLLQWAV